MRTTHAAPTGAAWVVLIATYTIGLMDLIV
jgi:hypothetical protein